MQVSPTGTPPVPPTGPTHPGLLPDIAKARIEAGRKAESGSSDHPSPTGGAPDYFRTYEEVKNAIAQMAEQYPNLVSVEDIGDSWEKTEGGADRDVLMLRLTNKQSAAQDKPQAFHIGGEHAREIANPELLMRWAGNLLEGYGTDPEVTALLDTREVLLVPMMNPDGHAVVERAFAGERGNKWHRKNTAEPDGTDLNRNYDFKWGGPGASSNPRSQTYRGPHAASEPETQAVQGVAEREQPGIFMDWHSYSELVLFPPGHTREPSKDHEGLKALATRFSHDNHYTPTQSINLYPTSGTSKDFTYGKLDIPSFTIETGSRWDGFHMSDKAFDKVWALNKPVLDYATKIADAPYDRVKGPEVLDVHVDINQYTVRASVSDALNGQEMIQSVEATLDPFSQPGTGIKLSAEDGSFDSHEETVIGDLSDLVTSQPKAKQLVYVRSQDTEGNWGPATAQWVKHPSFAPDDVAASAPAADAKEAVTA